MKLTRTSCLPASRHADPGDFSQALEGGRQTERTPRFVKVMPFIFLLAYFLLVFLIFPKQSATVTIIS